MQTGNGALLQGTLSGLVLKALSWGPRHGYAVARWVHETSNEALNVEDRALYLALHRLEERGLIRSTWGLSDTNRRAKYYQLTTAGRRELQTERARLTGYADAVLRVFGARAWEAGR